MLLTRGVWVPMSSANFGVTKQNSWVLLETHSWTPSPCHRLPRGGRQGGELQSVRLIVSLGKGLSKAGLREGALAEVCAPGRTFQRMPATAFL